MSPCHNLEPSLVARDSSRLLSVKPNEWMHLSPFYTRIHGEWLRYAKSTSQFHWRFLLVRDVRGFQVNPLCRHDITSPFPPWGNGGYVRNLDVPRGNETLRRDAMKHSSSRDAGSMALRRSVSFPLGTRVTYVTWDVPLQEHRAASRRYGERDVHAAILANPCLVCEMHSYGKGKDKPGVARRARS